MTADEPGSSATAENWHAQQDEAMDRSLERDDAGLSHPDPVFRTWAWVGYELLYGAHASNVVALKRGNERFRLLDLGCGTGAFLRKLSETFPNAELVGIDPSRASLERARERVPANITYVEGMFDDARALGRFDVVVCSEVFEHVERPDDMLAIAFDVLEPGGHLSFSTPSGWMWRRPGVATATELVNSPATPRLRDRPTPAAAAERARNVWSFYSRLRLRPEDNWREALPYHPGVRPVVARRAIERAGFAIVKRASSMWVLNAKLGVVYRGLARAGRRRPVWAAHMFFYGVTLLESLMNVLPPLRVFESRVVLLARKPG